MHTHIHPPPYIYTHTHLPEAIRSVDCLRVHAGVPGGVEEHHSVGTDQVNPNPTRLGHEKEKPRAGIAAVVEAVDPPLPHLRVRAAVEPEVVAAELPALASAAAHLVQGPLHDLKDMQRLAEDERLLAAFKHALHDSVQHLQLPRMLPLLHVVHTFILALPPCLLIANLARVRRRRLCTLALSGRAGRASRRRRRCRRRHGGALLAIIIRQA